MSHHETRNTTAVSAWCPTCQKITMHQVSDRRRGTCLESHVAGMTKAQERRKKQQELQAQILPFKF
jgi:ribosomal protein L44E